MHRIIVVLPLNDNQKAEYKKASPETEFIYCTRDDAVKHIETADAVIGNIPPDVLKKGKSIKWVQLNSAGAGEYVSEGVLPDTTVITNATGAYGTALSEHMMAMLLTMTKKIPMYMKNMESNRWHDEGKVLPIINTTTLIVGLGDIGEKFAEKMKAFGSHVIGIRRTVHEKPECVDEMYTSESLKEQLERADYVAICLPGVKETYHLFDAKMLKCMKPNAILINVGRGNIIDTDALIQVLREKKIYGAALDVTEPEPLSEQSPLWSMPNVLITPHVAGGFHLQHTLDLIVEIGRKNLCAYSGNADYINIVDRKTGYRKLV